MIKGKVVVITGAGSGIGKAIAKELSVRGARVVLGGRRTAQLKSVTDEIKNGGGEAVYAETDVRKKSDLKRLIHTALAEYGDLHVMINNAGIAQLSRIDELDTESWDDMIDINIKGVLYGMAAAIPVFNQRKSGHIINIISTSGIKIVPYQGVYAGTKNAVRTITEAFRQESDGSIRITGISPGFVKTDLVNSTKDEQMKAVMQESMAKLGISGESIANAVIYAMCQPPDVEVGDIVIRPSAQN
jgi:NADP-dependent 3-hydroxy acid dehydrogenase YdfG